MRHFDQILETLEQDGRTQLLAQALRGIEREGLRVDSSGLLAQSPHPAALGSALCHPHVTTDFSEALLELISPPQATPADSLCFMQQLHGWLNQQLGEELLWPASMPGRLPQDNQIPIARYGSSLVAQMKEIYREGLSWRYGRTMQTIAGIHYNFSLPDAFWQAAPEELQSARSNGYMALIRNFQRHCWLLMYLFGASPLLDQSFMREKPHRLKALAPESLGLPYATSLRMSDLGYQNNAQAGLNICYNTLPTYIDSLQHAISTPHRAYEEIGVCVDGHYRQLNHNLLQIENEYYSAVRPKRVTHSGERPIHALRDRGIEYVEIRCLDVNPLLPLGVDPDTLAMLDLFLWYCALSDSPPLTDAACRAAQARLRLVIQEGRRPGLKLPFEDGEQSLQQTATDLLDQMRDLAACMDSQAHSAERIHTATLESQLSRVRDPDRTPSGQVLNMAREQNQSFVETGLQLAARHRQSLSAHPVDNRQHRKFSEAAIASVREQRELEQRDVGASLEEFLAGYFNQH